MNNRPYGKLCCNCIGMQQPSCMCCVPGPQGMPGPQGPQGPPGPTFPARTVCVQMNTLFSTQTISVTHTGELVFSSVTPPGTYVAPFTVQSIALVPSVSYNTIAFSITPPSIPGGPSVMTMTLETRVEIHAVDANAAPFTIVGRVYVPMSVSMGLPPGFTSRNLQAMVTLGAASAIITSMTEATVTAEYTVCFNAFQTEMVSLQAGLAACACNGVPVITGGQP